MASSEDKIDILIEKVGDLAVTVKGIEVRLDNVESSLKGQEVVLKELSCNDTVAKIRLAELDAERVTRGSVWTRIQPFFLVVFTMALTGAVTIALRVLR